MNRKDFALKEKKLSADKKIVSKKKSNKVDIEIIPSRRASFISRTTRNAARESELKKKYREAKQMIVRGIAKDTKSKNGKQRVGVVVVETANTTRHEFEEMLIKLGEEFSAKGYEYEIYAEGDERELIVKWSLDEEEEDEEEFVPPPFTPPPKDKEFKSLLQRFRDWNT